MQRQKQTMDYIENIGILFLMEVFALVLICFQLLLHIIILITEFSGIPLILFLRWVVHSLHPNLSPDKC